jgi:competence protein ComGC
LQYNTQQGNPIQLNPHFTLILILILILFLSLIFLTFLEALNRLNSARFGSKFIINSSAEWEIY